ncbi:MAG TPA: hypothetical protein C5S37_12050 [Methanophagales archaeon]|nr:hypothetical protein [Methanophagales archaeon]
MSEEERRKTLKRSKKRKKIIKSHRKRRAISSSDFFGVFLLYVLASELIPRYSPAIIFILFALLTFYFWNKRRYISFGIVSQLIVSIIISVLVYFSLSFHSVTS